MRFLPLIFLTAFLHANEVPPVQYWTDTTGAGWLAAACQQEVDASVAEWRPADYPKAKDASRLTLIRPDGKPGPDFSGSTWFNDGETPLRLLPETTLPTSPWWHSYVGLHDLRRSLSNEAPRYRWTQTADAASLTSLGIPATNESDLPESFHLLAESVPIETLDPLVKAHGLNFKIPAYTIPDALLNLRFQQIHLSYDLSMRRHEAADPTFADWKAEIVHELRLLHASTDYCSALVITRARRMYTSTNVTLHSIHLQRSPEGDWNFYDPLDQVTDSTAFARSIDDALGQFDYASADFSKDYPNPLSPEARQIYTPLQIGPELYLLFEPYLVAAGAFGVITINPESMKDEL